MENVKRAYPKIYNVYKSIHDIDKRIKQKIRKKYGKHSIKELIALNDYNKLISDPHNTENVSDTIQQRNTLFNMLSEMLYQVGIEKGFGYSNHLENILKQHFKLS